jgi:hypothetical protein
MTDADADILLAMPVNTGLDGVVGEPVAVGSAPLGTPASVVFQDDGSALGTETNIDELALIFHEVLLLLLVVPSRGAV